MWRIRNVFVFVFVSCFFGHVILLKDEGNGCRLHGLGRRLGHKLAKLRRHASRVHFAKILVGYGLGRAFKPSYTFCFWRGRQRRLLHQSVQGQFKNMIRRTDQRYRGLSDQLTDWHGLVLEMLACLKMMEYFCLKLYSGNFYLKKGGRGSFQFEKLLLQILVPPQKSATCCILAFDNIFDNFQKIGKILNIHKRTPLWKNVKMEQMLTIDDRWREGRGGQANADIWWLDGEGCVKTPKFGWRNMWTAPKLTWQDWQALSWFVVEVKWGDKAALIV